MNYQQALQPQGIGFNGPYFSSLANGTSSNPMFMQNQTQNTTSKWNKFVNGMSNNANLIGMGAQAATGLIGAGLNAWLGYEQIALAKKQQEAQEAQRVIENKRYTEQLNRLKTATNNAANTASGLKSASAQVATTQQANTQAQAKPQQKAQQANTQAQAKPTQETAKAQDLPMQRE